jgi:hypothetical protein
LASVVEDGKLKIKTISDSPEIRNLSDHDDDNNVHSGDESGDEGSGDGTATTATTSLNDNQSDPSASSSC